MEENNYGEKYKFDPHWRGPLQKRSCTDVFCLLIFIFFVSSWVFVGYYAILEGNLQNLIVPTDSSGRKCGEDPEVKDAKFLVFIDMTSCLSIHKCQTESVCREKCPSENFFYPFTDSDTSLENLKEKMICTSEKILSTVKTKEQLDKLVNDRKCARFYFESEPVINRCLPSIWNQLNTTIMDKEKVEKFISVVKSIVESEKFFDEVLQDVKNTWQYIFGFVAASTVLCIVYSLLLKCLVTPFVYSTILAVCVLLACADYHLYQMYSENDNNWNLIGLIACSAILIIVVLSTIFLRNRIFLACQLIKESSRAVTSVLSTLIFPIFPWILQIGVVICVIAIAVFLFSISSPNYRYEIHEEGKCFCNDLINYQNNSECIPKEFEENCRENEDICSSAECRYLGLKRPWFINYMHGVNFVALYWLYFFIAAVGHMILAGTFATWYWTFNKKDVPFFTLIVSIWRTIRYHMGTAAFGSVLITICTIIRNILEYVRQKSRVYGENSGVVVVVKACKCCFWLLDKFLKVLNDNAYIMCSIHGKNFLISALDAFNLLMRNILRVIVLNKITSFVLWMGKMSITLIAGLFTWYYLESFIDHPLNHKIVPVILVVIGSYLACSLFFSVQSAAIDTLFLCFLEDCERNDGSPSKPYFMSKRLNKVLQN